MVENSAREPLALASAPARPTDLVAKWADSWVALWYRLTCCTRHGHKHSAFGGEVDDYCGNCGKERSHPPK